VFVRANGEILQINPNGNSKAPFIPDPILGHITAPRGFFIVAGDPQGNVWINSTPPRIFERRKDGTYAAEGRPHVSVNAADIQHLRVMDDGVVWFASDKGLFRYEPSAAPTTAAPQPPPLIQRVVAGNDLVLFKNGTELRHDFGRMRIEFAPVSYRPGVSYQYRLDPIDAGWSAWSDEPFIDYTTLEPNDYTFRLRARGPAMIVGGETQWSFTVLPPWYRTKWAHALMVLLALAALFGVIRVRTSALQRQAERLRARVAEQTAELQETVKLLESANTQLEALSLEDDLTGIANRRSFERALIDEWNRAKRHEQPLALVLLDLDHFKDLNDRLGHPAGDDCLRRVGAFLAESIKRSGEIVARYGGEEFAILLPGVDADIAVRVAETLRDGIERLSIPYGPGARRMTASAGVAAMVPRAASSPESLVASADRALYAAKHSGRNCVRLADETTTGTWLRDVSA
jgi:diguanylate cyclase (GGDEF)-like protein